MINGNVDKFIEGLHYGDERFFLYKGKKYFIQGYCGDDKNPILEIYQIECDDGLHWIARSDNDYAFPVKAFEEAKIFDGKSFWDVENEIEWVDC